MIIHLQVQHFNKSGRLGESLAFRTQLRHDLQSGGQNKIVSTWLNDFAKKGKRVDWITLHMLQGIYNGEHFSGACRGDDGGPLTVEVN